MTLSDKNLLERDYIVGASEIYTLAYYMGMDLLTQLWDKSEIEKPYCQFYELWAAKKGLMKGKNIGKKNEGVGEFVEKNIVPHYIGGDTIDDFKGCPFVMNTDTTIFYRKDLNKWLGATPDGWFTEPLKKEIISFDGDIIDPSMGAGVIESKAMNDYYYYTNYNCETKGIPLKFLFQINQQMLAAGKEWAVVVIGISASPTRNIYGDSDENCRYNNEGYNITETRHFVYKRSNNICKIILELLKRFNDYFESGQVPDVEDYGELWKAKKNEIKSSGFNDNINIDESILAKELEKYTELQSSIKFFEECQVITDYKRMEKEIEQTKDKILWLTDRREEVECNGFTIKKEAKHKTPCSFIEVRGNIKENKTGK